MRKWRESKNEKEERERKKKENESHPHRYLLSCRRQEQRRKPYTRQEADARRNAKGPENELGRSRTQRRAEERIIANSKGKVNRTQASKA